MPSRPPPRSFAEAMRGARPAPRALGTLEPEPAMPEGLMRDGPLLSPVDVLLETYPGQFPDLEVIESFRERVTHATLWTFQPDDSIACWAEVLESVGVDERAASRFVGSLAWASPRRRASSRTS